MKNILEMMQPHEGLSKADARLSVSRATRHNPREERGLVGCGLAFAGVYSIPKRQIHIVGGRKRHAWLLTSQRWRCLFDLATVLQGVWSAGAGFDL